MPVRLAYSFFRWLILPGLEVSRMQYASGGRPGLVMNDLCDTDMMSLNMVGLVQAHLPRPLD